MRFSILQLLIATSIVGAILGIAVRDGIDVALWLTGLVAFCGVCIVRTKNRWSSSTWLQKTYAATTSIASSLLLAGAIYSVATSATLANERSSRSLQFALTQEPKFSAVRVEYSERKIVALSVEGTVPNENDFQELRQKLLQYDWRSIDGIHWRVDVAEPKHTYYGWDEDLFDEAKY